MKIEANLLPKREQIETNRAVDWFSTLEEVKRAKKRLYNPNLRTPESKEVWNKLPSFLERKKNFLGLCVGSEEVTVHLHGSMSWGVGNDGKRTIFRKWKMLPSDIDILIFTGEKRKREPPEFLKGIAWVDDFFFEQTAFEKEFNRDGQWKIVEVDGLMIRIKEICNKLSAGQEKEITYDERIVIFKTALLFGSDALLQSKIGLEAKWRNELLKIILENPGGEKLWNEGIRKYFNLYIAGYEDNSFTQKSHKKRVDIAFEEILAEMQVSKRHKKHAKRALSEMRAKIQLPEFQVIQNLKDKLG